MIFNKTIGIASAVAAGFLALITFASADAFAFDNTLLMAPAGIQFGMFLDIWFMLMLVAFLMIFIKKFEWGTCLAVLFSAAGSYLAYMAIQEFYFDRAWSLEGMINAVICAITVVIAIGCFLGLVKMWQYLLVGVCFAPMYVFIQENMVWLGTSVTDPGGSILVHMCAAYFGLGVAFGIHDKRALDDPMKTSKHSITFVWLASMLLWMLWPSFVCSLLAPEDVTTGAMTCYMAGIGSVLSAYLVCQIVQKKVNPLIYTYAMLAGPVAIGAPLLLVGPWAALLTGIIAGAVSALAFIFLQPWLAEKTSTMDVMGVHNLHGVGGWIGVIVSVICLGEIENLYWGIIVALLALACGFAVGLLMKYTRGSMDVIIDDSTDFFFTEEAEA